MKLPNTLKKAAFLQPFQDIQWAINPPIYLEYLESSARQYPDIFIGRQVGLSENIVLVSHPQGIQEIFTNDRKKYLAPGKYNRVLPLRHMMGESAVIMLDGDRHKRQRQLLMPCFHSEGLYACGQQICDVTAEIFQQNPINVPFSALKIVQQISLQVILRVIFGINDAETNQKFTQRLLQLTNAFRSHIVSIISFIPFLQQDLGSWSPWGKFLQYRLESDNLIYSEITKRREQSDTNRTDVLSAMMKSRYESGELMDNQELRDQLMNLLMGGYEITGTALVWGLYLIHTHPDVLAKLLHELDTLGDITSPMNIFKLPYLTAVCHEILRLFPGTILTFPREVAEPVELLGYSLEPGMVVAGCVHLLHQREDLYPQPKLFKPERFLERQFSSYEFIPFGGGVRRCIGDTLVMFEMKLIFATLFSRYKLALVDQPEVPRIDFGVAFGAKMVITGYRMGQEL